MSSINLSQSSNIQRKEGSQYKFLDAHFVLSTFLLLIAFGAWGGVEWYNRSLDAQSTSLDEQIQAQQSALSGIGGKGIGEKISRVIGFQKRSEAIKKHLETVASDQGINPNVAGTVFSQVEKYILPSVTLKSYSQDAETGNLNMDMTTDDFRNVARQIMSFKTGFPNASVDKLTRDKDGLVPFSMHIVLDPFKNTKVNDTK